MLYRLWHALVVGHAPRVMSTRFNRNFPCSGSVTNEDERRVLWGFTEVVMSCQCGRIWKRRFIGDHSGISTASELEALERMAK